MPIGLFQIRNKDMVLNPIKMFNRVINKGKRFTKEETKKADYEITGTFIGAGIGSAFGNNIYGLTGGAIAGQMIGHQAYHQVKKRKRWVFESEERDRMTAYNLMRFKE